MSASPWCFKCMPLCTFDPTIYVPVIKRWNISLQNWECAILNSSAGCFWVSDQMLTCAFCSSLFPLVFCTAMLFQQVMWFYFILLSLCLPLCQPQPFGTANTSVKYFTDINRYDLTRPREIQIYIQRNLLHLNCVSRPEQTEEVPVFKQRRKCNCVTLAVFWIFGVFLEMPKEKAWNYTNFRSSSRLCGAQRGGITSL